MHYLLFYDVGPDYLRRRSEFRKEHLTLAWASHTKGELIIGGALAEPVDRAILLFEGESPAALNATTRNKYQFNELIVLST